MQTKWSMTIITSSRLVLLLMKVESRDGGDMPREDPTSPQGEKEDSPGV